jgi:hypothetical protein
VCTRRIRIRGSYLWLTDPVAAPVPDPDPALFVSDLQEANKQKNVRFFFAYFGITFEGTFTSFFEDKKSSHKEVRTQQN